MINYPFSLKDNVNKNINNKNKGMFLEDVINNTNEYYRLNNIALIYKKPTPIQIVKLSTDKKYIEKAFFKEKSTTDYNGIYKGKYIDFEAKETKLKSSFPLNNIHEHQIRHLNQISKHGGIGFIIVRFTTLNETYLLRNEDLFNFLKNSKRKSIPLSYFKEYGFLIKDKYCPRVDYLSIVDKLLEGDKYEKNY